MSRGEKELNTTVCILCSEKIEGQRSFTCRKCRKTPFCLDHLDAEHKLCPGCAAERRIKHFNDLLSQEKSLKAFMGLSQLILVVSAVLFASRRFFYDYVPEILKDSIFYRYAFVWGILAIVAVFLCYVMLSSQRQRIRELEGKIQEHRVDSRYMRR